MALQIRRLEARDETKAFDCGEEALNEYLKRYAWQNQQRHLAGVTYIVAEETQGILILGYYTLAVSSIPRNSFPGDSGRRLSPYPEVPVLLLARLAVDRRFQRRGIGEALMAHALHQTVEISKQAGCRALVVDAYQEAADWYSRLGFRPAGPPRAEARTQKMFLDLRTIEKARP